MFNLGQEIQEILNAFAHLFSKPVWLNAQILIIGAILCIRKRTVTSALRVMGLGREKRFTNFPIADCIRNLNFNGKIQHNRYGLWTLIFLVKITSF